MLIDSPAFGGFAKPDPLFFSPGEICENFFFVGFINFAHNNDTSARKILNNINFALNNDQKMYARYLPL